MKSCTDFAPAEFAGHWREWHRGHGCDLDAEAKTTVVAAVEKFPPRHPAACRHCGHVYNHHQRADTEVDHGCCGGAAGPLVRCPACGCPADAPMNRIDD